MTIKITDIEVHENDTKHNIPNIVHFLPGCNEFEDSWRKLNPEFVFLTWDNDSLKRVIDNTKPFLNLDLSKDEFVVSSILCYNFGGIVITRPEKCFLKLQNLLGNISNTLLCVFLLDGAPDGSLDSSIMISSAKISAFSSLMEYFKQAKTHSKSTNMVFHEFVNSSMLASNDGAILCLNSTIKNKLVKEEKTMHSSFRSQLLEGKLPSSDFYKIINSSHLASEVLSWLNKLNKKESKNDGDKIGILVIDNAEFDEDKPIPQAINVVLEVQKVNLCHDAIIIVAHSPATGISLDMMLLPQMHLMNGKEIYRNDHVVWKLN
jgi:hypothetical protein